MPRAQKAKIIIAVFVLLSFYRLGFAENPSVSQIQRTQEILEKEGALEKKIGKEEKVFIRKTTVKGAKLLTEEEIRQIVLPYQKRWFYKNEIEAIPDALKKAYQKKGLKNQPARISFRIKRNYLQINVDENPR